MIDNNLIRLSRVTNGVDRAFRCCPGRGDAHIKRIDSGTCTLRKIPLRGTGRRGGTRPDVTHDAALRAAVSNIIPALIRSFIEARGAVIHQDARRLDAGIFKLRTRGIDLCAVVGKRRIRHP